MIRKAFLVGAVFVVVLGALTLYYGHQLRTGPQIRSGTLALEGLEAPVEILYDSMGVPHIFAASVEDLFLAQGYVHATHRLWQMEMFRRVLQGRLSEIFGERTLDTDRFLRTIGMEEAARTGTPPPGTPMYELMERYATGVNAAIAGWRGLLPPEFVLLRFRPEPWTPVLAQGIEKLMAWDLSDYQTGLNLAAAREVLGDSALAPLLPRYPEWGVTIVDGWPENTGDVGSPGSVTRGSPGSVTGNAAPRPRPPLRNAPPPPFPPLRLRSSWPERPSRKRRPGSLSSVAS
jgi:penicillin G amidase